MDADTGRVIQFPGTRQMSSQDQSHKITNIDGMKYYTDQQIRLFRRTVRDQAALDLERNQVTAVREWMAVDLITSSGIRVSPGFIKSGHAISKFIFLLKGTM